MLLTKVQDDTFEVREVVQDKHPSIDAVSTEQELVTVVFDKGYEQRARKLFKSAMQEAFNSGVAHRVKQGFKTWRNVKVSNVDRYDVAEVATNAVLGTVIGVATAPIGAFPALAGVVVAGMTAGSGRVTSVGFSEMRLYQRRKDLRARDVIATALEELTPNEAVAAVEAADRHWAQAQGGDAVDFSHLHLGPEKLAFLKTREHISDWRCNDSLQSKSSAMRDKAFAIGAKNGYQHNAESRKLVARADRLSMKKSTYFSSQLGAHVTLHEGYVAAAHATLEAMLPKIYRSLLHQAHLSANHECSQHCCFSESELARLNVMVERFERRRKQLAVPPPIKPETPSLESVLSDARQALDPATDDKDWHQAMNELTSGPGYRLADAAAETGLGEGVSQGVGQAVEGAAALLLGATGGGVGGALLGKAFGMIGEHWTVSVPARKEIAGLVNQDHRQWNDDQYRQNMAGKAATVCYALKKLGHYRDKLNRYLQAACDFANVVGARPRPDDSLSKWASCDEAYQFAKLFCYCLKTLIKYEAHVDVVRMYLVYCGIRAARKTGDDNFRKIAVDPRHWRVFY